MIPSTADTPTFVTTAPAWEHGVDLEQAMDTSVFMTRAGLEERQQRRQRGKYSLSYKSQMARSAGRARDAAAAAAAATGLIVPFWTEPALATTDLTADTVTIDRTPDADWFTAGDWVFFTDPTLGDEFREIASVSGDTLTLVALGGSKAYLTGVTVYPCRACVRATRAEWQQDDIDASEESHKFSTL